jgi:hypothetical protein
MFSLPFLLDVSKVPFSAFLIDCSTAASSGSGSAPTPAGGIRGREMGLVPRAPSYVLMAAAIDGLVAAI